MQSFLEYSVAFQEERPGKHRELTIDKDVSSQCLMGLPGPRKSYKELTQKDVSMKTKQGTRRIILQKFISSLKKKSFEIKKITVPFPFQFSNR